MEEIFLGRMVKAFGIRGELKFHPSADFWEEVLDSKQLVMRRPSEDGISEQPLRLERSRPHGNSYVVKLDGVDDRNTAETLVGSEVFAAEESLDVDLPGVLLPYQVIGMEVVDPDGNALGEVIGVIHSVAHDVYEVAGKETSFLLPAVPEFVLSADRERGTMVVDPLPGLIGDA